MDVSLTRRSWAAALAVLLVLSAAGAPALADTVETVAIFTGRVFENTGWNPVSAVVDVSKIRGAEQVTLRISGSTDDDPWLRFLIVKIDGQLVSAKTYGGRQVTDVVGRSFDLRYDVTSLVKDKSSVQVEVVLTTYVGSWTVSASFEAVKGDTVDIPTGGDQPLSIPLWQLLAGLSVAFAALFIYLQRREE